MTLNIGICHIMCPPIRRYFASDTQSPSPAAKACQGASGHCQTHRTHLKNRASPTERTYCNQTRLLRPRDGRTGQDGPAGLPRQTSTPPLPGHISRTANCRQQSTSRDVTSGPIHRVGRRAEVKHGPSRIRAGMDDAG
eukprot:scaffold151759_cov19-Prasinocladus_malaysianus.AAC.1